MKIEHLPRYGELAVLLTRYGLKDFHLQVEPGERTGISDEIELEPGVAERAAAFATKLKEMGPAFVKFGQILSTRPDIVPPEYIRELETLQDQVEPFSFGDVETIVESELGVRISKLFEMFEATPVAAASLGQVHRAILRDGRAVVVKVQRPDVRKLITSDLDMFREIATELDKHTEVGRRMNLVGTAEQLRRTLLAELDYLQEARNAQTLRENLAEFPEIYIPLAIADLTTSRVLTTELVAGRKVSELTPLAIIDHDYAELAATLTRAYLKQICVDGLWHADPHPGNVFVQDDQLVLLDFGMVGRLAGESQNEVVKLLLGVTTNRGKEVASACIKMGRPQEGFDSRKFHSEITDLVANYQDLEIHRGNAGHLIFQVIALANSNHLQVPSELALLAKTMLHLETITRVLDPQFDPKPVIRDYAEELVMKRVRQKLAPKNYYSALLDLNELLIELPNRTREILDLVASGKALMHVEFDQADHLLKGMHRIANRIMVGLIVAALLVASAFLMSVPSGFRIGSYPGLAIIGYVIAAAIGLWMVFSILWTDRHDRAKVRKERDG